jgi:hypothetical protein
VKLPASGFDLLQLIGQNMELGSHSQPCIQTSGRFAAGHSISYLAGRITANQILSQAPATAFNPLQITIIENSLMPQPWGIFPGGQVGQQAQEVPDFRLVPDNNRSPVLMLALAVLCEQGITTHGWINRYLGHGSKRRMTFVRKSKAARKSSS